MNFFRLASTNYASLDNFQCKYDIFSKKKYYLCTKLNNT